jgi:hypothetical protein
VKVKLQASLNQVSQFGKLVIAPCEKPPMGGPTQSHSCPPKLPYPIVDDHGLLRGVIFLCKTP